jgi:glyoxylase-like metal-dependent hydrolase (beta-lactamase superfamily II)
VSGRPLPVLGSDRPWSGGPVTERAWCVLAPNPGPMTLDGTNTWVLHEPGGTAAAVLDPGPDDPVHLRAILDLAADRGVEVVTTLLTHGHPDHAEGARRFADLARTPVLALDPTHRLGAEGLDDGDVVEAGGLEIRVVATPGHTADCLSFHLPADGALLTGDTVLGRGTTVVAWPDGRLGPYLDSLARLRDLALASGVGRILPGHGPDLDDAAAVLDAYLAHRRARLDQVREAVAGGARTPGEVVAVVYADVPRTLWPAAELSVRAQLHHLEAGR